MKLRWIFLIAVLDVARGYSSGFILHLLKHKARIPVVQKIVTPKPISNCICVPYYQCGSNNTIITDGKGIIDVRNLAVRRCKGELEVCCGLPSPSMASIVTPPGVSCPTLEPVTSTTTTMAPSSPPTTMAPSSPPTTMRPTSPPTTMRPTSPPTTMPPTSPPTTMPPTSPPTTMPPTSPPTTMPPTSPPTTMRPTSPPTTMDTMRSTEPTTPRPPTSPSGVCVCVPIDRCDANGFIVVGGEGIINPRQTLNPCPITGQICCKIPTTTKQTQQPIVNPTPTQPPTQPATCVCVQSYQCGANGYIIISGIGKIDPRFPTTRQQAIVASGVGSCASPNEICCRISTNGDDSSPGIPGFPDFPGIAVPTYPGSGIIKNAGTPRACVCVTSWQCAAGDVVNLDGAGVIDPRFGACPNADEVCCRVQGITRIMIPAGQGSVITGGKPSAVYANTNVAVTQPTASAVCGLRSAACPSGHACGTGTGETSFAEFPWMVALFVRPSDGSPLVFQCGASIINTQSILTAAHCVIDRPPGALVARFGEWNTAHNDEPAPYQDVDVQAVVTHPLYYSGGLYNDVAVLILAKPITYAVNVVPICLPQQGMTFSPGTRCLATGWGRSAFEGQYQTILRKVDLPMIDRKDCQTRLRSTRLGQYFQLHESFICAGGETSKDTCRGDGGGPLICPTATGQFVQAGIVSWGIGCGESNTPAVYASVSQFRQWIDRQLASHGVL